MILHWMGLLQWIAGTAAVILMLRCVFRYEWKKESLTARIALFAAAAAEVGVMLLSRADPETADYLQEALLFGCSVALPYALLRYRRKQTFFLFGLAYCATTDYIASIVPAGYADLVFFLIDSLACLLALAAGRFGRNIPPEFPDQAPAGIYIAVFTADLNAYYSGMLNHDASYYAGVSAALKVLSFLVIGGSVIWIVRRYLAVQRAEQTASEQLAVQLRHYEELEEKNRLARSLRHDYENNLLSLGVILDAGQTEDARDYVRRLQGEVHAAACSFSSGSYFADAILSDKAAAAAEHNVQLSFSGTVPNKGIANPDLCTILCNLLDNAVRACRPCAPCTIEIEGHEAVDRWRLTVKNPVAQRVVIRGGVVRSSKPDAENHGFGLTNVRRTAEQYNGYLELQCDDRCFTAEVGLMLNTEVSK